MWGSRAGRVLCAVVTIVLVLASAQPVQAAPHPVRPSDDRLHRGTPKRIAHEAAPTRSRKASRAEAKRAAAKETPKHSRTKSRREAQARTPATGKQAREHKSRRHAEPEADPPLMHRTSARRSRVVEKPKLVARAEKPLRVPATAKDFAAAASGDLRARNQTLGAPATTADALPPDQTLPVASENVAADVQQLPLLPARKGRGKQQVLPEDHAARQAVIEQAVQPVVLPTLYSKRGRLIVPAPLKGSREILVHQNTMADTEGLDRIADDVALEHMQELHLLVPLRDTLSLAVNEGLPENRRYARPWAARFAADLGRAYYARFHQPLHLNSAVRTVEYQLRLQRVNGNAAAVDGDGASPHLTGQALDFGKRGMSLAQISWMRLYLGELMRAGKIDVEEEFQQACFHVSVYKSYLPSKTKPTMEVAEKKPLVSQP